jgi:hypothetical protein
VDEVNEAGQCLRRQGSTRTGDVGGDLVKAVEGHGVGYVIQLIAQIRFFLKITFIFLAFLRLQS